MFKTLNCCFHLLVRMCKYKLHSIGKVPYATSNHLTHWPSLGYATGFKRSLSALYSLNINILISITGEGRLNQRFRLRKNRGTIIKH